MADLNNLKYVNDTEGHHIGDAYIVQCARDFQEVFDSCGRCFRLGGDEFLFLGSHIPADQMEFLEGIFVKNFMEHCQGRYPYGGVSTGYAVFDRRRDRNLEDVVRRSPTGRCIRPKTWRNFSAVAAGTAVEGWGVLLFWIPGMSVN